MTGCHERGKRRAASGPLFVLATLVALLLTASPALAKTAREPSPGELFARALGNDDVSYTATRTSLFWSDNGQTRALVARVYKDGERVRYEYPARGNRPASVVIETPRRLSFVLSARDHVRVTTADRKPDVDLEALRVKLALANYRWRYEPSTSPRRRVVSAWRPGAAHPSQRFWIATSSFVIVRSERYGPGGELRASWSLDSLNVVPSLPSNLFEPPAGLEVEVKQVSLPEVVHIDDVRARVGFEPVRLRDDKIPAGYRLVDVSIESAESNLSQSAVRLTYSDGLDAFSLLETRRLPHATEKMPADAARDVDLIDTDAQLFTSAEVNLVHWQDAQRRYTLMGSMPPRVLMELSRGVIASTPAARPQATASGHATIPTPKRRRGFTEIITRGWSRFLRLFGL